MDDSDPARFLLSWDDADLALLTGMETAIAEELPLDIWLESQSTPSHPVAIEDDGIPSKLARQRGDAAKPVGRSTLCRQRQRDDLEQLRRVAAELEAELQSVRVSKSSSLASIRGTVWEMNAQHERQRRRDAQVENERLRDLLRKQQKMVTRLEAVVLATHRLQRVCQEELHITARNIEPKQQAETTLYGSAAVLAAMQRHGLLEQTRDYEKLTLQADPGGRMELETAFCKVLPKHFALSSAEFWASYCSDHFPQTFGLVRSSIASSSGRLIGSIELPVQTHGQPIVVWSRFRIRCAQESSERVEIWWEDDEADSSDAATTDDRVRIRTDAYLSVESLQSANGPTTVVRAYSISKPDTTNTSIVDDPIRVASGDLVKCVQAANNIFSQRLERFFLRSH